MRFLANNIVFLVVAIPVFAQHEHHTTPMPQKQSLPQKENIVEKPINQRITSKPKVVRYDLYIRDTTVTFGNKPKRAIAVNGQIPMPTLSFTEGDTAEIYVHNELNEETSLHWHGLF